MKLLMIGFVLNIKIISYYSDCSTFGKYIINLNCENIIAMLILFVKKKKCMKILIRIT